jgi:hypothetical protein
MEQGWPGLAQFIPAVPADWSPRPRTVQDALDQLGARGGGAGFATSYVWRPGGVAAPGVYTTWPTLVAAFAGVDPAARKIVAVDDSIAAAHITTGAWANCDNVEFVSGGADATTTAIATVIVDQGASLSGVVAHLAFSNINCTYAATSGAFITTAAAQNFLLDLSGCSLSGSNLGGNGLVSAGAGSVTAVRARLSSLQGQLFAGTATSTWVGSITDLTTLSASVVNMTAGATVFVIADGSSVISAAQSPAPTITIEDPTPSVVFRPGGVAGGNVYTTWASMMADLAQFQGPKDIYVDDSLAAAHVTAGAWNLDLCTLIGNFNSPTETLIFDVGATITATQWWIRNGLVCQSVSTAAVWTTTGAFSIVYLDGGSNIQSAAAPAVPFITSGSTTETVVTLTSDSFLGDGTHAVLNVPAGKPTFVNLFSGSTLDAAASTGAGTRQASYDSSSTVSDTTFALNYLPTANLVTVSGNTGTGTHTVTTTTGNISKKKTGKVNVYGSCAGATAAADTITATLVRDVAGANTTIATQTVTTTAGQLNYNVGFGIVDTLPDALPHTYSIRLAGAQNNTVAANQAIVNAQEIGG